MRAINLFNKWVSLGKDDGMETNHAPSVDYMLDLIPSSILNQKFSFLDIGCGNGWVVRKVSQFMQCNDAVGIDGSDNMIKKAILKDSNSKYLKLNIDNLKNFNQTFDIIFSMEVFYYLKNPQKIMNYIFNNLLKSGGCCIIGIDHYLENTASLHWQHDLNVDMCTYSIFQWKKIFQNAGFSNVFSSQFGNKKDWAGTLVLYGEKP